MSQHEKHARQHHHTIEPVSDQVQQSSERLQFKHAMAHLDVHQQVQMMRPNAPIQMSGGHEGTRGIHKAAQEGIQGNSRSGVLSTEVFGAVTHLSEHMMAKTPYEMFIGGI
ncbi:MAG: hypothetical protein AAFX99_34495, partial [Myxococcota bacterium]